MINAFFGKSSEPATPKEGVQMVFIDTPGIHKPNSKLGSFMTESAMGTFKEVDVVLFLVDERLGNVGGDRFILDKLSKVNTPKILIINKTDTMSPESFTRYTRSTTETGMFEDIMVSVLSKEREWTTFFGKLESMMPEGPMYFPEGMVTDHPERFIVSEIIREKLLLYLKDEVPHGAAVEIESFKVETDR